MKFIEFRQILENKNIILFDFDYRNSYKNIFILNDIIVNNNEQMGGSNKEYYISPFNLIQKEKYNNSEKNILKLIDNLVNNNLNGAKYLCKVSNF